MKKTLQLVWNGYRYFPYEREFARREVKALMGTPGSDIDGGLLIEVKDADAAYSKLRRLTYFRHVILPDGSIFIPDQVKLEESILPRSRRLPHPATKQSTRYSGHGLHEYRGKFNPQVVRAIGNMLNLQDSAWVLDPFCGSGTTLLECAHSGWNAVGIDLNPLGIFISNSKIIAAHTRPEELSKTAQIISDNLKIRIETLNPEHEWSEAENELLAGAKWAEVLPNFDYLLRWFPRPVLAQIAAIVSEIDRSAAPSIKPVYLTVLSDVLRDVSYQDPGDLRIRRRKNPGPNYPALPLFLERLKRNIKSVINANSAIELCKSNQAAFVADSRLPLTWIENECPDMKGRLFDAVITSPPYATALPYIDTQRLSLSLLGLVSSKKLMGLDRQMIGTREILDAKRREVDSQIKADGFTFLGESTTALCRQMVAMVSSSDGFRRRNMPALIYGYYQDMAMVLHRIKEVLKPNGTFALIVGSNKTVLGGDPVIIDTPSLLADIASSNGWEVSDIVKLDTYQRYNIHQKNSIKNESLILLKKRG